MKDYKEIQFSLATANDDDARVIINNLKDVTFAAATNSYGSRSMVKKFAMDGVTYAEKEMSARKALLSYAASKAAITKLEDKKDLAFAFENPLFVSIFNSIVSETINGVVVGAGDNKLIALCNMDTVEINESKTYNIEPKGLPIAQRGSYMNNVAFLDGYTESGITVTPKMYTTGASIDYIRILANDYDFGKELAKVAMSLLYAQYKLVTGLLFNTAKVTGTPFYKATFTADGYIAMISDLQTVNNTGVKAYGTLPAFQKQGVVATTNYGFESQDQMIRDGFLGRAYGVDNVVIDQATDLSAPFTDATRDSLLLVPSTKILLVSDGGDKPVKLVRENFVKVLTKEATSGSLYRQSFNYSMAFDAGIITSANYGIQSLS
jgi:hypothetical protein